MQVHVDRDFRVELQDADDFTRFRLAVDADPGEIGKVRQALRHVAELERPEIAWVSEEWLRRHARAPQPADWNAGFAKMLAFAATRGWVRADPAMVRAHVVWLGQRN